MREYEYRANHEAESLAARRRLHLAARNPPGPGWARSQSLLKRYTNRVRCGEAERKCRLGNRVSYLDCLDYRLVRSQKLFIFSGISLSFPSCFRRSSRLERKAS